MKLNWDNISYLFQIPVLWFREADRKLNIFSDGHGILVERNNPDGTLITTDPDALADLLSDVFVTLDTAQTITGAKTFSSATFSSAWLTSQPTDTTTSSLAVSTVGYGNAHYWRNDNADTGFLYNDEGTLEYLEFGTTSGTVAEGDHTHTTDDLTDWSTATEDFLTSSDIGVVGGVAAYVHGHSGYAASVHTHTYSDISDAPDLSDYLDGDDIGTSVQEYSSALSALEAQLTSDGKVPLSMLTGNINGHSGTCYVTIDTYGNLGHSENLAYNLLNAAKTASASALATDKNIGDGLAYSSSSFSVKVRANYGLTCDTNGLALKTLTANKWMKTDASGLPTTTDDKVVTIASNQTGQTTNVTLVTGVTWNGTQLVVARTQLNFSGGVLTGTTSPANTTISTVAYSP